jgi:hypothetical protein
LVVLLLPLATPVIGVPAEVVGIALVAVVVIVLTLLRQGANASWTPRDSRVSE